MILSFSIGFRNIASAQIKQVENALTIFDKKQNKIVYFNKAFLSNFDFATKSSDDVL